MQNTTIAHDQYTQPPLQVVWENTLAFFTQWIPFESMGQQLLESALRAMPHGTLTLQYPDGHQETFGNGRVSDSHFSPHARMTIHTPQFFKRILLYGHVGAAESYMDGEWDTDSIQNVIAWFIANVDNSTVLEGSGNKRFWVNMLGWLNGVVHQFRPNSMTNSRQNIHAHYDLSNAFFNLFLDDSMTYSSGLFLTGEETLAESQVNKYQSLVDKLRLKSTDHVLEIGSGWGGFAIHAARTIGCQVTTITISEEQYAYAKQRITEANLHHLIDLRLQDYRTLEGQFDKLASIEMVEALGDAYYETFWQTCNRVLKPHGLAGIQMITCPDSRYDILKNDVDFIQKHIFPGSLLPSIGRMNAAVNKTGDFSLFEVMDMGLSYAKTLNIWGQHFNNSLNAVRDLGFDEHFIRKWNYYLEYCEAAFATRNISVVQAIYTRPNNVSLV